MCVISFYKEIVLFHLQGNIHGLFLTVKSENQIKSEMCTPHFLDQNNICQGKKQSTIAVFGWSYKATSTAFEKQLYLTFLISKSH